MDEKKVKKPLIIFNTDGEKSTPALKPNFTKQNLLLKGLVVTEGDLGKARKMAGIRTMAETYQVLDRLALRKDYHIALQQLGISFDWIVKNVKDLAENSKLDTVKLRALMSLMKSLGVDSYEREEAQGTDWERLLREADKASPSDGDPVDTAYDVEVPPIPDSAKKKRKVEDDLGKDFYTDG